MTKLDRFDRFEEKTFEMLALVGMWGGPVVGILAAGYFLQRHQVSWWLQVPVYIVAIVLTLFLVLAFGDTLCSPVAGFFRLIRRRTGRKPLEEIERMISDEQIEEEAGRKERAKAWFANLGQDEQLRLLFLTQEQVLDYIRSIHSHLQYVLLVLIGLGVFMVVAHFLK